MANRKEIFHVLGMAQIVGGKKRFVAHSPAFLNQKIDGLPLQKELELKFSLAVTSRSKQQLAYYWVLLGLISEYNGNTPEELHDWVMRVKFGTKKLSMAGITAEVRRSISELANMPKGDCVELIDFVVRLCGQLEIHIPTGEELGYIVGEDGKIIK